MVKTPIATEDEINWAQMRRVLCRESLIAYIQTIAPWFTVEEVHCVVAQYLEALAEQEIDRLMLFMAPRAGKSATSSIFFPSWYTGKFPSDKILQVGHSSELSRNFSLDVRELMRLPEYEWIFPGVRLAKDAKAAGKWRIEEIVHSLAAVERRMQRQKMGEYNAAGVTTGIAGKGFNLGIADDLMSEQDKNSKLTKDRLWNWWGPGFYTRRQPEKNAILLTATRWSRDDVPGHLIDEMHKRHHGADVWTICNIPAILDRDSAKRVYTISKDYGALVPDPAHKIEDGGSFAPRRWPMKELMRSKSAVTESDWQALYMGNPSIAEGHILKKRYWRLWPRKEPPDCVFIFQMYDTAFDKGKANDNSARSTWGVFEYREKPDERPTMNMVLLDAWEEKVEAPDLKKHVLIGAWGGKAARKALLEMNPQDPDMVADIKDTDIGMHPDKILIENKASGLWLVKELRRIRKPRPLPVQPWTGPRGGSATGGKGQELGKYARAHMASLVLEQGAVWYMSKNWAQKVIDKCAECKFDGTDETDDLEDTVVASMIYVRQTYRVELGSDIDEEAEEKANKRQGRRQFYGTRAR